MIPQTPGYPRRKHSKVRPWLGNPGCSHRGHSLHPWKPVGFHLYFSLHIWPIPRAELAASSALYCPAIHDSSVHVISGKQFQHKFYMTLTFHVKGPSKTANSLCSCFQFSKGKISDWFNQACCRSLGHPRVRRPPVFQSVAGLGPLVGEHGCGRQRILPHPD